ncbi:MAG TPA: class I SAM-dependent methyltransferase [Anaeromyxobacteraceae bacterium]|nr:class I SAM-dependent methyltransferase [Anaeromyxobacteraceae bacterium]
MAPPNPWALVPAADYEAWMGPGGVDQLGPLSAIFGKVYSALRPARVALLGCATGNGLEHVDPAVTRQVIGVDVNIQYLAIARQRFLRLGSTLELYCEDVLRVRLRSGALDLVHAALIFEHVDPLPLAERIASWLAPGGACSVVLQLTRPEPPRGSAPPSMAAIAASLRLVEPAELRASFRRAGLAERKAFEVPVGAARFLVALFAKPK